MKCPSRSHRSLASSAASPLQPSPPQRCCCRRPPALLLPAPPPPMRSRPGPHRHCRRPCAGDPPPRCRSRRSPTGRRQLTAAMAGGGCPYQVSAGRQKEEVASANIELDRRESEIYVAASKKKTRGRSSTLGGRFLPGFLEKGRNRFIWKL